MFPLVGPFLLPPQVNEHAEETKRKDLESLHSIPGNVWLDEMGCANHLMRIPRNEWFMDEPDEKNNDRRDEHEGDENDDSERIIFVDRPNFSSDEILSQLH